MWRRVFRPDVLFLLGTLQGLLPYLLIFGGAVPDVSLLTLSYYPIAIWVLGYISFWIGTRIVPRGRSDAPVPEVPVSLGTLKAVLALLCAASLIEMVGLAKVYGGIPLLLFASGAASVNDTNSAQAGSGFGQVGAAGFTLCMLVCTMILLIIKSCQKKVFVLRWLAVAGAIGILLCVFNGKRQGLFMYALIVSVALTISLGSPRKAFEKLFHINPSSRAATVVGVIAALVILPLISGLASLRNNSQVEASGAEQLGMYYIYPTMNLSLQCIEAGGFGPFQFRPLGLIISLVPAKLDLPAALTGTAPPRVEITSPSGFYERLQWDLGLWGIILFPLGCGMFCQWMYQMAFRRFAALLTYGLISWALFSAPIYNHFFDLLYLLLPGTALWSLSASRREIKNFFALAQANHRVQRDLPSGGA